jgi:hypothetical protein
MLERAKAVMSHGADTAVEYARFADDLVILVHAHPRHDWVLRAVAQRLREELARLHVEVNEEKTRIVDLTKGECTPTSVLAAATTVTQPLSTEPTRPNSVRRTEVGATRLIASANVTASAPPRGRVQVANGTTSTTAQNAR